MPLSGWTYYQILTLAPSTGAGMGYQVTVPLTAAGLYNHARSDFGDVRFTLNDGLTLLIYQIFNLVSGVSATFLVQVPLDLSTSSQTIFVQYGNAGATTTGSNAVYDLYDDATSDKTANYTLRHIRNTLGNSFHWDATNHRYYYQIASSFSIDMLEFSALSLNDYQVSIDFSGSSNGWSGGIAARYSSSGVYPMGFDFGNYFGGNHIDIVGVATPPNTAGTLLNQSTTESVLANNWYTLIARVAGSSLYVINNTTGKIASVTNSDYGSGTIGAFIAAAASNTTWIKNMIVRHYVSPEPYVSATGPEQTMFAPLAGAVPAATTLIDPTNARTIP